MSDKLVCDIHFYFYLRLIFGYYNDFGSSWRVRYLAMLYCAFFFMIVSSIFTFLVLSLNLTCIDIILGIIRISEYVLYVLISITKKNEFLKRYYKKMMLIDNISNVATYKPLRAYLITYLLVIIIYKIFIYPCVIIIYYQDVEGFLYYFIFKILMTTSLVCGRQTVVFVMALMYCRIRSMRRTMKKNEFNCSSQGNRHPRRYIQIYETIMRTLEATDHPLKIQLLIFCTLPLSYYLYHVINLLQEAREEGLHNLVYMICTVLDIFMAYAPIIVAAILSDLISLEVQDILIIIMDRRIECKNERDYAEIEKLFKFIKSHPFNYTVCHLIPLNLHTILSFTSFCLTTIIAILQIKNWNI